MGVAFGSRDIDASIVHAFSLLSDSLKCNVLSGVFVL